MKHSTEYPPNIEAIQAKFGDVSRAVFTYGDTLHNPNNGYIPEHLARHEEAHAAQQGNDPEGWWKRYLEDPAFRIEQEAEAYRAQYQSAGGDRNFRALLLHRLATDFSSPLYGSIISYAEARRRISE